MKKIGGFLKFGKTKSLDRRGFTLVELVVGIGLSAILTGLILAALTSSRQICTSVTADQDLQQTANVNMNKIIKGGQEPGGIFRLSEAASYTIPNVSELHFIGIDGVERFYFLQNAGTELRYHHPTAGGTLDELLYKAPAGTTLTLRFWPLITPSIPGASPTLYTNITVGIDFGLSKTVNGRIVVGSATTMINIRNHAT
jgi:prepilin-type N-terminal cleavage/methylation domain-containing protein